MLNLIMQNSTARTAGARLTAQNAAPNDPSLVAYAGLQGQLGGQSDASGQMAQAANSYYGQMNSQAFQEAMLRLRAQLEEEAAKRAAGNPLLGGLGQLVGGVGAGLAGKYL
jgi:transposase